MSKERSIVRDDSGRATHIDTVDDIGGGRSMRTRQEYFAGGAGRITERVMTDENGDQWLCDSLGATREHLGNDGRYDD